MTRAATILLILTIAFANALCVCAMNPTITAAKTPRSCHQSANPKPFEQHGAPPRECAHCSGMMTMEVSSVKTIAPAMTIIDSPFLVPICADLITPRMTAFAWVDHTGLSPPVSGRTLFDLACLMNA